MMYPYITFSDETEVTHSHIITQNGRREIQVHFERPTDSGFNTARCILPNYEWKIKEGFTDKEMEFFEQFLQNNAHLIFHFAETGGVKIA